MLNYFVTVLVLAAWLAIGLKKRLTKTNTSQGAKIQHTVLVLLNLYIHASTGIWFLQAVIVYARHGAAKVRTVFCIDGGILPDTVSLPIWCVLMLAGAVLTALAAGMYAGSSRARKLLVSYLPCIYMVDSFTFYLEMQVGTGDLPIDTLAGLVVSQILFALLFGWLYIWMYRFYRSEMSDPIFGATAQRDAGGRTSVVGRTSKGLEALRHLFGIRGPTITLEKVQEIVRQECERHGWHWNAPVYVNETLRFYRCGTTARLSAGSLRQPGIVVYIDVVSGEVVFSRNTASADPIEDSLDCPVSLHAMFSFLAAGWGALVLFGIFLTWTLSRLQEPGLLKSVVCVLMAVSAISYSATTGRKSLKTLFPEPWKQLKFGLLHIVLIMAFGVVSTLFLTWVVDGPRT